MLPLHVFFPVAGDVFFSSLNIFPLFSSLCSWALTEEVLKFPSLAGDSVRCLLSQLLGRLGMTT